MAGPRWIFERAGGFDENIRIGGSETELAIRAQRRLDIDVVGVPGALVWHRLPTTTGGWFRKHFARERGHAYIRRRHRGAVRRPSFRIGVVQIARGASALIIRRKDAPVARSEALALMARGAGGCLGSMWWGAVYGVRMPSPRLLRDDS
jgi:GT2 family glycosyltransferase